MQTPREVMAFIRTVIKQTGSELDSLYIKELTLLLADIEAANKARVRCCANVMYSEDGAVRLCPGLGGATV